MPEIRNVRCAGCGEETSLSESKSYLDMTFGLAKKVHSPQSDVEESAVRVVARHYQPVLALNWHGAGSGGEGEPFPNIYPGVEINAEHSEAPRPPLRDLQADLFFCAPGCFRDWINRAVDELEFLLRTGKIDGQVTNPGHSLR